MNREEEIKKEKLMNDDMYCNKYEMSCLDVPHEVLSWVGGFGFSCYECELNCNECSEMELW